MWWGVPLGTLVGQSAGWRVTFFAIAALGVLAVLGIAALVPQQPRPGQARISGELAAFRNPQVLLAMAMTVLGFGGVFTMSTYITPMLTDVAGYAPSSVTWLLVLFGLGMVGGNLVGGRFADRSLMPMLYTALGGLTLALVLLPLAAHDKIAAAVVIPLVGAFGFATVPPLQKRVLDQTADAPHPRLRRQHRRVQPRQRHSGLARRARHIRRLRLRGTQCGRRRHGRRRAGPRPALRVAGAAYEPGCRKRRRGPLDRGRLSGRDRDRGRRPRRARRPLTPAADSPPLDALTHPSTSPLNKEHRRMTTANTPVLPLATDEAEALIAVARCAAEDRGVRAAVTVLDGGGHLLAFRRDDRAVLIAGETSTRKAFTALQLNAPTADVVDAVQPGGPFHTLPTALDRPLLFIAGGVPLHRDGRLIGAIGVGGGAPEQDHRIAVAAIEEVLGG
ncbi:hypothetical protein GCM10020000_39990 [Streptomyces olivoverticillatus]